MEMQTLGGSIRMGVVQSKDLSAGNPTTLDPVARKFILHTV
jgi:hypothetical protein